MATIRKSIQLFLGDAADDRGLWTGRVQLYVVVGGLDCQPLSPRTFDNDDAALRWLCAQLTDDKRE